MPILFLLCGLPGSGKTTLARRLEVEHAALTLNLDAWMVPLFGQYMTREVHDARVEQIKGLQWNLAERLLSLGVNVVLDWAFWTRAERDSARSRGERIGAEVRLIYLHAPPDELWRRIEARNRELPPDTFEIIQATLDFLIGRFEPPTPDEGAISL